MKRIKTTVILSAILVLATTGLFLAVSSAHPGVRELSRRVGGPAYQQMMQKVLELSDEGHAALYHKDYTRAERKLRQSLTLDTTGGDAGTWRDLGRVLEAEGRSQEAHAAYQEAFDSPKRQGSSSFPVDIEALVSYGAMCEDNGQHEAAVRAYNKAVEGINYHAQGVSLKVPTDPKETTTLQLRALLDVLRGLTMEEDLSSSETNKSQDALESFQKASQEQPNDARVQFYHGYGLQKAGQFAEAQAAFQKAAALDTEGTVRAAAAKHLRAVQAHRR